MELEITFGEQYPSAEMQEELVRIPRSSESYTQYSRIEDAMTASRDITKEVILESQSNHHQYRMYMTMTQTSDASTTKTTFLPKPGRHDPRAFFLLQPAR